MCREDEIKENLANAAFALSWFSLILGVWAIGAELMDFKETLGLTNRRLDLIRADLKAASDVRHEDATMLQNHVHSLTTQIGIKTRWF